jgi:acyl carrier protein
MRPEEVAILKQADIQQMIRRFVLRELITADEAKDLKDDDSLFQNEVLDSVSILQLLAFVDAEFDVRIESEDVNPDNFDSIERLARYVKRKLACDSEASEKMAA